MKMNYFVVGTNDMVAARTFYDALFAQSGLQSMSPSERMTYWIGEDFAFATAIPFDTKPATNGNGTMVGFFCVGDEEEVRRMYAMAIELGGHLRGRAEPAWAQVLCVRSGSGWKQDVFL